MMLVKCFLCKSDIPPYKGKSGGIVDGKATVLCDRCYSADQNKDRWARK